MFWDGDRWLPDDGRPIAQRRPLPRRRFRDWAATGIMVLALVGLAIPFSDASAALRDARTMLADWRAESNVSVVQESSSRINYRGGWQLAYHPDYLGGKARGTDAAGAKASLRFRGVAVSWVGPAGPTRGKARVYIDGTHVATVNTWAATFRPTRVLFKTSWDSVGSHKIAIVAIGTRGHPTVALDAFLVRLDSGDAPDPVDDAGAPIGTAPPGESPAPSATPAPSPTPDAAPSATPTASPTPAPTPLPTPTATPAPTPLPTATPAPTPLPTATPAPTPLPTATPAPATGDPWAVAFGTRPRSGAISLNGCRDVVISNKTFRDLGANVIAIRLENCTNVTISAVDFINVAEGVYALNSSNIRIIDSRYQNITGPHERDGHNRGNFVQLNNISGGLIDHNKGKGGDTEDVVSIYRSSNVVIEDNHFEGTNWTSTSGSGIALGDGGGSGNVARRNVLVNVGQVGAFIAGGSGNRIEGNTIYGAQRELSNVGIYVWAQGSSCSNATVSGNKVWFKNAAGQLNGFWNGGNCGQVTMSGNDFNAPLNLEALGVAL